MYGASPSKDVTVLASAGSAPSAAQEHAPDANAARISPTHHQPVARSPPPVSSLVPWGAHLHRVSSNPFLATVLCTRPRGKCVPPEPHALRHQEAASRTMIRPRPIKVNQTIFETRFADLRAHAAVIASLTCRMFPVSTGACPVPSRQKETATRSPVSGTEPYAETFLLLPAYYYNTADAHIAPGPPALRGPVLKLASSRDKRAERSTGGIPRKVLV